MTDTPFSHRPPRSWLKVSFSAPSTFSESAAAFLADKSGSGVEIAPVSPQHPDAPMEIIIGYLPNDENGRAMLEQLNAYLFRVQKNFPAWSHYEVQTETIIEEDWGVTWKKDFKPARITGRLVVKPSWEEYAPDPGDAVLEIDPGMAFGTGLHASTRLALEIIDLLYHPPLPAPRTVLDLGTGTGILAMACALFGAARVVAVDNDPDAVAAALENITRNHLEALVTAGGAELLTSNNTFDLVIANITHDTIIELASLLTRSLKSNGRLILSGILQGEQEQSICRAMAANNLTVVSKRYQEEWFAGCFEPTA